LILFGEIKSFPGPFRQTVTPDFTLLFYEETFFFTSVHVQTTE